MTQPVPTRDASATDKASSKIQPSAEDPSDTDTERGLLPWVQAHAYALVTVVALIGAGVAGTLVIFPEISTSRAVIGGALLGLVAALTVVTNRLID